MDFTNTTVYPFYSIKDAARMSGINYKKLYRLVNQGLLEFVRDGYGRIRLSGDTIEELKLGSYSKRVRVVLDVKKKRLEDLEEVE